jgi:hypothetical protein
MEPIYLKYTNPNLQGLYTLINPNTGTSLPPNPRGLTLTLSPEPSSLASLGLTRTFSTCIASIYTEYKESIRRAYTEL